MAAKSAEISRRILVFRSTFTRMNRTRFTSSPSRAIPSITRSMANCAFIAAEPAATNGKRSRKACRKKIATSMSCATPCRWIRSNRAAFISARPAARSTRRPNGRHLGTHRARSAAGVFRGSPDTEIETDEGHRRQRKKQRSETEGRAVSEMIRVVLPHHLRTLARVTDEVQLDLNGGATVKSVIDAIEAKYPALRGTIRDHDTLKRRSLVRFFACGEDISHESPDAPLPDAIANGMEPFFIMGAIAGG